MTTEQSQDTDRRVCERTPMRRVMRVDTPDGESLQGETLDISLGGVLLATRSDLTRFAPEQSATLFVVMPDQSLSSGFPCTIRRVEAHHLGLEVDRKSAPAFGKALTKGMLGRKA